MKTPSAFGVALLSLLSLAHVTADGSAQVQTIQIGPGGAQIETMAGPERPMQLPGMARQMKTGTGRIKGRILTSDTGAPVRRAQVRLMSGDTMPKTAVTDSEGRYEFRDLPAGKYTITATKSGFVSVQYGQTRPYEQGKSIELIETQPIDKADITLPRGSVISGRILDEFGDPLPDASVAAMRSSWTNGKRRLQPAGRSGQTNDLGQYRIYGLPPGDYYVSATLRSGEMMMMEMAMTASFTTGPQPSGSEPRSGYAPTYYPGTANGAEAQKIPLAVGQEAQNTDFGMLSVKLARVSGTVTGSDGRPVEGAMINASRNGGEGSFSPLGQTRTDKNGNFTVPGVAPGDYTLRATGFRMNVSSGEGGDQMVFTTRVSMGGDGLTEVGAVPLVVSGEDVANVMIVTSKGTSVTGRVIWEGGSKPTSTGTLRMTALPIDSDGARSMGGMMGGGAASVTPEGSFEIKGLAGQRMVRPMGVPQGWVLKAVRLHGQDVTDSGIDVKPGEPVGALEVVLISKTTEVNGTVKANNQPANDYTVVIFAEDSQKWTVPMTRYVTGARPNQEGRFQVKNLPAGSYYAVALDYIAQGEWNDPEVLERIKAKATRFTLDDGGVETLDLKLSGN